MGFDAVWREVVSGLSYILGHPAGVKELLGVGKTHVHLVVTSGE